MKPNLARICFSNALSSLFKPFYLPFIAIYLFGLGFDGLQMGFLLSLLSITSIFASVPVGIINDRLDIRYTLLLGHVASFTFFVSAGTFSEFWTFIPIFLIGGIGLRMIEISYRSYIFKDSEPWHEGRKYGTFTLTDIISYSAGAILGMSLVFLIGFSATLIIIGFYYLALTPVLFLLEPVSIKKSRLIQYEKDFLHANNILLAIIVFIFATHWGAETTSYGLFLENVLNLNSFGIGLYSGISIIFLGIAAFVFGNRMDHRTNFRNIFMAGLLVSGAAHILQTIPDVYISLIFRCIHEAGDGIAWVSLLFWLGRKFSKSRVGGDSGIFFLIMTIGGFTGALVYGPIGFAYGYSLPLVMSGITTIICAGLFYILKRRLG